MKVILRADIKGVGKKDQVINASDGYARNFLFPKNLAVEANAENMSKLKAKQDSNAFKKSQEKEEAERTAEKLSKILLKIKVKSGTNGKIFGGVSSKEIAENLEKQYEESEVLSMTLEKTTKNPDRFRCLSDLYAFLYADLPGGLRVQAASGDGGYASEDGAEPYGEGRRDRPSGKGVRGDGPLRPAGPDRLHQCGG